MRYGSVCSGIEAASVAWGPLGWKPSFLSEIDKFPRRVLAHHYPETPLHGDFTTIRAGEYDPIDLLVGGTPCQSFSIAGLRGGLDDDRGNLALEYLKLAQRLNPRWLVWENVPGVLSSNEGRDFGAILGGLVELGYGFAYGVRDAQFVRVDGFGRAVPQRRRRVFVVGYLGDWRRAAAVLFERESLRGHTPPRREAGKGSSYEIAPCIAASGRGFERTGDTRGQDCLIPEVSCADISPTLNAHFGHKMGLENQHVDQGCPVFVSHSLRASHDASEDGPGRGTPIIPIAFSSKDHGADAGEIAPTLRAMGHSGSHANGGGQLAVAFDLRGRKGGAQFEGPHETANIRAASGGSSRSYLAERWAVRRLTPTECERLQGFPDGYTDVFARGKDHCPDGPRYKALGNSMAVNCMRWIGTRIQMVEAMEAQDG